MTALLAILPFVIMVLWDRIEPRETESEREARWRKLEAFVRLR